MTGRDPAVGVLRAVIAGLAGTIAGIHIDLWNAHGYRHIPTIGTLFLLNGIAGCLLALASLGLPRKVLPLGWTATAGFAAATLAALLISVNAKLFGFTETVRAPLAWTSIAVEATACVAGAGAALWLCLSRRGDGSEPVDPWAR